MKNFISFLTLLFFLNTAVLEAQIGFKDHIITDKEFETSTDEIFTVDIDKDGDLDIITRTTGGLNSIGEIVDGTIKYFENLNNSPNFKIHYIFNNINRIYDADVSDFDGDGDIDIVLATIHRYSAYNIEKKLIWLENDGKGNFNKSKTILQDEFYEADKVIASDIDGDNDFDLIFTFSPTYNNRHLKNTIWLENTDGKGSFTETHSISSSVYYWVSADNTSDIDGDGDQDFVFYDENDKILKWYKNIDGKENFETIEIDTNTTASIIKIKDVNNDGNLDIVVLSLEDDTIFWYKNKDGKGNFSASVIIEKTTENVGEMRLIDLDKDNDLDIVYNIHSSAQKNNNVFWKENLDGLGNFGNENQLPNISSEFFTRNINAGDIDNDGDQDIIMGVFDKTFGSGVGKVVWLENNNGKGSFNSGIDISNFPYQSSNALTLDIDNDGDKDIITSSPAEKEIICFKNIDGKGYFSNQILIEKNISGEVVKTDDIDNDGDTDFIFEVTTLKEQATYFYENTDGLGNFKKHLIDDIDLMNHTLKDLDGDQDLDLLVAQKDNYLDAKKKWFWYKNDGLGNFEKQNNIFSSIPFDGYAVNSFIEDIDGDEKPDLVLSYGGIGSTQLDYKITWLKNLDGFKSFDEEQIIYDFPTNRGKLELYSGDIDNDKDIDLLYVRGLVLYSIKNNAGEFEEPTIVNEDYSDFLRLSDIDNDGDLDIITAYGASSNPLVSWYENLDGLGKYGSQQFISNFGKDSEYLEVIDIDNDGDNDIISTSSFNDSKIIWHENTGIAFNEITGTIKLNPAENDCVNSSIYLKNILITSYNDYESFSTFSLTNGIYQLFPNQNTYTTKVVETSLPNGYTANPTSKNSTFSSVGLTDEINFCIEPTSTVNDLNISVYPALDDPRPGFDTSYKLVFNNVGTTQLSGNINFEFDDAKIQLLKASETINSKTNNTLTFNFEDLNPFETRTIQLDFNVFPPPTTDINEVLISTATINAINQDDNPKDNKFSLNQILIGSYDPNDIRVLEGSEILLEDVDDYLHYIIRFQNTGTASAINVNVENELDKKLDWKTLKIESLSHKGSVQIKNGKNLNFIFDDIHLPDSTTNEPKSHGYITYKIKPKNDVGIGDTFKNKADIFFDFNPPITTNTVTTEIVNTLSTDALSIDKISVYPNPVNSKLYIQSYIPLNTVIVFDINGRVLKKIKFDDLKLHHQLNISDLSVGIYFLKLQSESKKQIKKFIKK